MTIASGQKNLSFEITEQVGWLKINRPQALNALNTETLKELLQVLEKIQTMPFAELRVLVITGEGEKAFVAGADIKEINSLNSNSANEFAKMGQTVFRQLELLKIPVVAAVNGFALGGGLELALACDYIMASEKAKFGLPEVSLGLIPGFGGTVRLARVVGPQRAKELIYSGRMLSADEAFRVGLANAVYPAQELLQQVKNHADMIKTRGPIAITKAKEVIQKAFDQDVDTGLSTEAESFASLFTSQDVREGTQAFIEKRAPQFSGK